MNVSLLNLQLESALELRALNLVATDTGSFLPVLSARAGGSKKKALCHNKITKLSLLKRVKRGLEKNQILNFLSVLEVY
jgi:hypothetical protein